MTTTNAITPEEMIIFKKAKLICKAADHKLRKSILDYLHKKGEATVTEVYVHLRLEQSVASQHLAILRKTKFVNSRRDGKNIFYSVNAEMIAKYVSTMQDLFLFQK